MKKLILTIVFVMLFGMDSFAQIKVHQNGWVSIGTLSGAWDQGFQFEPGGCAYFNHTSTTGWPWVTMSSTKSCYGKCWIVSYPNKNTHTFYVTGNGFVYSTSTWERSAANNNTSTINNPGDILDGITGYYYEPSIGGQSQKSNGLRVGLLADEIKEVLPEAVTTDDSENLYIDYNAITAVLIEAVKEQRKEIELLKETLRANGLIEEAKR